VIEYGQNVFSRNEVSAWCSKFKDYRTVLNDDTQKDRSRPRTSHTDENCVIVEGLIKEDRRVKVHENDEVTGIAKSTVYERILYLNVHNRFCSLGSENAHRGAQKQKNGCFACKSLPLPRLRRIVRGKHRYRR
jgi:hypothetical protein